MRPCGTNKEFVLYDSVFGLWSWFASPLVCCGNSRPSVAVQTRKSLISCKSEDREWEREKVQKTLWSQVELLACMHVSSPRSFRAVGSWGRGHQSNCTMSSFDFCGNLKDGGGHNGVCCSHGGVGGHSVKSLKSVSLSSLGLQKFSSLWGWLFSEHWKIGPGCATYGKAHSP